MFKAKLSTWILSTFFFYKMFFGFFTFPYKTEFNTYMENTESQHHVTRVYLQVQIYVNYFLYNTNFILYFKLLEEEEQKQSH